MNFNNRISGIFTALFLAAIVYSCGEKKAVADDRADRMNETTREAQDNPENEPDEPVPMDKTTGDESLNKTSEQLNDEGYNEMQEVSKQGPMGSKKMIGGALMDPTASIINNLGKTNNFTTFVTAVRTANLVATLQGSGPFTVFAPTDAAFKNLSQEGLDELLSDKEKLQNLLKYHIIPGSRGAADIVASINQGNGEATFNSLNGKKLTASLENDKVILMDDEGNKATVVTPDVKQSNGFLHVVDAVLKPGS